MAHLEVIGVPHCRRNIQQAKPLRYSLSLYMLMSFTNTEKLADRSG